MVKFPINPTVCNKVSDFENSTITTGYEIREGTLQDLANCLSSGYATANGLFEPGTRREKRNVTGSQIVFLDVDNSDRSKNYLPQLTIEQAKAGSFIQRHCALAYTSVSHKEDWHRFRLGFLLPEVIEDVDIIEGVIELLMREIPCDSSCKAASRIFYGNTNADFFLFNPDATLPKEWITKAAAIVAQREIEAERQHRERLKWLDSQDLHQTSSDVRDALRFIPPRDPGSGNYDECRTVLMALHSHYGEAAEAIAESWSPSINGNSWQVGRKLKSFRKGGVGLGSLFHIAKGYGWKKERKFSSQPVSASSKGFGQKQAIEKEATLIAAEAEEEPGVETQEEKDYRRQILEELGSGSDARLNLFDIFPHQLASILVSKAGSLPVAPEFLLQPFLGVTAGILGTRVKFEVKQGYKESCVIWSGLIGDPGTMKSPAVLAIKEPLDELQKAAQEEYDAEMEKYKKELAEWDATGKEERLEMVYPVKPTLKHYYHDKWTTEALIVKHSEAVNKTGFSAISDELSGLFHGLGQYKGGKGDDRQTLLSLWNGSSVKVSRVSQDIYVPKTAVSITGGIQAKTLKGLMQDTEDSDGMWGRFTWVNPPYVPDRASDDVFDISSYLLGLYQTLDDFPEETFTLSAGAWNVYKSYVNWQADYKPRENSAMKNCLSKMKAYLVRLAGLLHCLDLATDPSLPWKTEISRKTMEKALQLVLYYINQVKTLHAVTDSDQATQIRHKVGELSKQIGWIDARTIVRKRWAKNTEEAKQILVDLMSLGIGKHKYSDRGSLSWQVVVTMSQSCHNPCDTLIDSPGMDFNDFVTLSQKSRTAENLTKGTEQEIDTRIVRHCDKFPENRFSKGTEAVTEVVTNPVTCDNRDISSTDGRKRPGYPPAELSRHRYPHGPYMGPLVGESVVFTCDKLSEGSLRKIRAKGSEYPWGATAEVIEQDVDLRTGGYFILVTTPGGDTFSVTDFNAIEKVEYVSRDWQDVVEDVGEEVFEEVPVDD